MIVFIIFLQVSFIMYIIFVFSDSGCFFNLIV